MRLPVLAVVAIGGAVLAGLPASAAPPSLSAQDAAFVAAAGYGGNFEVAGGELAQVRANSPDVKEFGARMVTDHNRAGAKLTGVAEAAGASPPNVPDSAQQHILKAWSRLDGKAFDCSYGPAAYLDHVGAIGLFQAEAAHGSNPSLVAFARDTLPTLQEHKQMISTALTALDCSAA